MRWNEYGGCIWMQFMTRVFLCCSGFNQAASDHLFTLDVSWLKSSDVGGTVKSVWNHMHAFSACQELFTLDKWIHRSVKSGNAWISAATAFGGIVETLWRQLHCSYLLWIWFWLIILSCTNKRNARLPWKRSHFIYSIFFILFLLLSSRQTLTFVRTTREVFPKASSHQGKQIGSTYRLTFKIERIIPSHMLN